MCYSIESSLRTSGMSLIAIIYLLSSGIPKFQYLGIVLIGWCGMQLAEAFLWMTNPKKSCTTTNRLITLFIIPIVLLLQPLASIFGSVFIQPWNENKNFKIYYSLAIAIPFLFIRYIVNPLFFKYKFCTTVTPNGHLDWFIKVSDTYKPTFLVIFSQFLWTFLGVYPLVKFWTGKRIWPFFIIPVVGMILSLFTDSPASIWCHITSYSSISAILLLFLYKHGIKIID